jgi:hypothetical protein
MYKLSSTPYLSMSLKSSAYFVPVDTRFSDSVVFQSLSEQVKMFMRFASHSLGSDRSETGDRPPVRGVKFLEDVVKELSAQLKRLEARVHIEGSPSQPALTSPKPLPAFADKQGSPKLSRTVWGGSKRVDPDKERVALKKSLEAFSDKVAKLKTPTGRTDVSTEIQALELELFMVLETFCNLG